MSETQLLAESSLDIGNLIEQDGTKKAEYLSYRVCNCTVREAVQLSKITERTLRYWREKDEHFAYVDGEGLTEYRKKFANEMLDMEFTKNFRMVMKKDLEVLLKSLTNESAMTDREQNYLLKMRSHYSPQNLAAIKQLLGGGSLQEPFDFTKLTLTLHRERESLEIRSE